MDRRKFIKTSLCAGCAAALAIGCKSVIFSDAEKQKFIYKDKSELPKRVKIDACTLCQLHCVKCPLKRDTDEYLKKTFGLGYLKFENFRKLVDDNFFEEIELSRAGEIFLNPDLKKIIEYAFKKNIRLTAYTGVNLNTLSDEMAEALVKYQFSNMVVSIDGATPETYAIYRRGGDFNKVIANIKKINHYKKKYNSKFPLLQYKFILFGHNEHEIEKAKELAESLDMKISFAINNAPDYSPIKNVELVKKQIPEYHTFDENRGIINNVCRQVFNSPQINWNGDLLGCPIPYKGDKYGNVFKEGFMKVLNSDDYIYTKRLLTDFSLKPKKNIICMNCETYKVVIKENIPMELTNG